MLRKLRIAFAAIFIIGITLLFVGIGHEWWGWMAKLQFLPSCFALNFGIVAAIVIATILFGRIYCSVICPLGVFQDIINWISSRRKNKDRRFKFVKERKWLRYGIFTVFAILHFAGLQAFAALVAPYSAYGRIVRSIVAPAQVGAIVIAVAAITLVLVAVLAWLGGRTWCNNVCPVGTLLGLFSNVAFFRPRIDESKCIGCKGCEKKCKASCIDSTNHKIDYSRCVDCFDCLDNCKVDAIKYHFELPWKDNGATFASAGKKEEGTDAGRRAFIAGAALAVGSAATLKAQDIEGGLAAIEGKKAPQRTGRLVPFGAESEKAFYRRCTACQLCVSTCPNGVLRPSTDLEHMMQPVMGYEKGYCRPECTACSQVCPAGAINPITPEEKTAIHIGRAVVDYDLCVVNRDGVSCGNCSRHCPVGAIVMVSKDPSDPRSPKIPTVLEEKCIGCGACENLCPSRPYSAIHVNGLDVHIKD